MPQIGLLGDKRLFLALVVLAFELFLGVLVLFHYAVPVILMLGLVGIILIVIDPRYGYLLCVIVLPFSGLHIGTIGESNIELIQPVLAFTIVAWFIKISADPKIRFKSHPLYFLLMLFLLWGFVTCIWSSSYFGGLWGVMRTAWVISLVPFSINLIRSYADLRVVLWTWGASSAVAAALAFGMDIEATTLDMVRSTGTAMHPNLMAMYLNLSIFLLIGNLNLARSRLEKFLILLITAFDFGALLSTGSRGAFFGLVGGLALMSAGRWRLRVRRSISFLIIVGVIGFLLFRFIPGSDLYKGVVKRLKESPRITEVDTFVLRTMVWVKCYEIIKESRFMGIGINGYERVAEKMGSLALQGHPHNFYLQLFLELGFIGMIIFTGFLVQVGVTIVRALRGLQKKKDQLLIWALVGGLTAFCLHAVVDFTFTHPEFWFFLGVTIAATEVLLDREAREEGKALQGNVQPKKAEIDDISAGL